MTQQPEYIGHLEEAALDKIGRPAGFKWYRWEVIGDAVKLTGCVVTRTYSKGPRKGRPVFDGPRVHAVVTRAEEMAQKERFASETGKCADCCGRGEVFASWNHLTGTKYKACQSCNGRGTR